MMTKFNKLKKQLEFQAYMVSLEYIPMYYEPNGYVPIWEKDGKQYGGGSLWNLYLEKDFAGVLDYLNVIEE